MQNSFVKMMSTISEIENHILKGLVLDEHGQWIPIADKKAVEEDFLSHLMAGQVLHEGRWVSIGEAKSAKAPTEIATTALEMPHAAAKNGPSSLKPENPVAELPPQNADHMAAEQTEFAPETKTIVFDPSPALPQELPAQAPIDPVSGYAPETGAFTLETPPHDATEATGQPKAAAPDDPLEYTDRTTTSLLLPTVSSWEQSARKRQRSILIFGTLTVVLLGIGAIAVLVVQLAR